MLFLLTLSSTTVEPHSLENIMNAIKRGVTQIERARIIKRTLGTVVAARYMKARGWSIEAALWVLA